MKHHYIPQFYLRQWLGPDHKLQEFRRGHKGRLQTKRYGTVSTGYEEDLYVVPGVTEETKQNIERYFMGFVDNSAVKARDMLLDGIIPRDPDLRYSWARFVLSLVFRNPEELTQFKADFARRLMTPMAEFQSRYQAIRKDQDPVLFEDWIQHNDPTYAEREAIKAMARLIEHPNALHLLRNMYWVVLDTGKVSNRLMTSDRPVVMSSGLMRFDGHYGIPISPTRMFLAFTAVDFAERFCALPTGKIVREVNDAVVGQARKYVYSIDRSNFSEVKRKIGKREAPSFIKTFSRDLDAKYGDNV
ncbi:DUF4238 domain-containing protein [Ciceribacter sp. L1K22]|uniref:DUF4238 domain-containing protein n=1 Tax=Ciceribacter sp. L1K22 TaxID=2820275 RepID=UPI001ABE7924|nr:DUF4238 domain-containing protein [Ciceribacter sp. L1K22]MBO3761092.1 DUF4238 domain-containing protein [Ciceribacter sp. L1K22]